MICDAPLSRTQQLKGQKLLNRFSWMNGFSYMCLGETIIILFAVKLACPNTLVAALGAMQQFAFVMMPLGKMVTARIGAAQSQGSFWVCRNIAALLVASAAVWEYLGQHLIAQCAILAGAFFFYGFRAAGVVMSKPLAGNFTVEKDRAAFFARNTSAFYISSIAALLMITVILRYSDSVWILTAIIILGSSIGITSSKFFRQMDESSVIRESARRPIRKELGHAFRNSHFRSLQYAQVGMAVSMIMLHPPSLLTLKRGCNVSDMGMLLYTLIVFGTGAFMSWYAGKIIPRIGVRKTILFGHALRLLIPWFWIFMPEPYSPGLAVIPFLLYGVTSVVTSDAASQYFLRALPPRSQVAAAMISAVIADALSGVLGMVFAAGLLKLAEHLAGNADSVYTQFRIYFMLSFIVCAAFTFYPVLKLKRFAEKTE